MVGANVNALKKYINRFGELKIIYAQRRVKSSEIDKFIDNCEGLYDVECEIENCSNDIQECKRFIGELRTCLDGIRLEKKTLQKYIDMKNEVQYMIEEYEECRNRMELLLRYQ